MSFTHRDVRKLGVSDTGAQDRFAVYVGASAPLQDARSVVERTTIRGGASSTKVVAADQVLMG